MMKRRAKLNAAFDELLRTTQKPKILNLKPSSCQLNISTDSSDNVPSPICKQKDSIYLFATPPVDVSSNPFLSPCLFPDTVEDGKRVGKQPKAKKMKKEPNAAKKKTVQKKPQTKPKNPKTTDSNMQAGYREGAHFNWKEINDMKTPVAKTKPKKALKESGLVRQALFSNINTDRRKRPALVSRDPNAPHIAVAENKKKENRKKIETKKNCIRENENFAVTVQKRNSNALDTPGIRAALFAPSNKDSDSECLFSSDTESLSNGGLNLQKKKVISSSNSLASLSSDTGTMSNYKTSTPNHIKLHTPQRFIFGSKLSTIQKHRQFRQSQLIVKSAKNHLEKMLAKNLEVQASHDYKLKNSIYNHFKKDVSAGHKHSVKKTSSRDEIAVHTSMNSVQNNRINSSNSSLETCNRACRVVLQSLSPSDIENLKLSLKTSSSCSQHNSSKRRKQIFGSRTGSVSGDDCLHTNPESFCRGQNTSEVLFPSCDKSKSLQTNSASSTVIYQQSSKKNIASSGVLKDTAKDGTFLMQPKTSKVCLKSLDSAMAEKNSSPKLTQTCLPFLPDNPGITEKISSPKLTQTCLTFLPDESRLKFVQMRRAKKVKKDQDENEIGPLDSHVHMCNPTSPSPSSGPGKLVQTVLDIFMHSSDSEFSGFSSSELSPLHNSFDSPRTDIKKNEARKLKNNRHPSNASYSSPNLKASKILIDKMRNKAKNFKKNRRKSALSSSNLNTSKILDTQAGPSDSRTRSLISYFLDLSVDSCKGQLPARKSLHQILEDGVKCSTSLVELLQGKEPKVVLERLDEGMVKAALRGPLTSKSKVMCFCDQTEPIPFKNVLPQRILRSAKKIGEGSYGEVFSLREPDGSQVAVKIIPVEGDQKVNGEPQMTFKDVLSEVILSKQLHYLSRGENHQSSNFIQLHRVSCVVGKYPKNLLTAWTSFQKRRGTENDNPGMFQSDQLYIIFQFSFGGTDLEIYKLKTEAEAVSIFSQVACSLAVAESALEFEHRDLHWGNILVGSTSEATSNYIIEGKPFSVKTNGVSVSLIDFTLSRVKADGVLVFKDISDDPQIFSGKGDIQFDVYRQMKKHNQNKWDTFCPYTNILWLEYLAIKLLFKLKLPRNKLRRGLLFKWSSISKQYKSSREFVLNQFLSVSS